MKKLLTIILSIFTLQTYANSESYKLDKLELGPGQIRTINILGLEKIKSGVEKKDPLMTNILGGMYLSGTKVELDTKKGAEYVRQAAELGRGNAIFTMYGLYRFGIGVERDIHKAIEWLEKYVESFIEIIDFDGQKVVLKNNENYIRNAVRLLDEYYRMFMFESDSSYISKHLTLLNELITMFERDVRLDRMVANDPYLWHIGAKGMPLTTDKQITDFYNRRADEKQARLDRWLIYKKQVLANIGTLK